MCTQYIPNIVIALWYMYRNICTMACILHILGIYFGTVLKSPLILQLILLQTYTRYIHISYFCSGFITLHNAQVIILFQLKYPVLCVVQGHVSCPVH